MNERELKSILPESLLSQISMVMQKAYLFRGTIRENLCFGDSGITEERMLNACKKPGVTSLSPHCRRAMTR